MIERQTSQKMLIKQTRQRVLRLGLAGLLLGGAFGLAAAEMFFIGLGNTNLQSLIIAFLGVTGLYLLVRAR